MMHGFAVHHFCFCAFFDLSFPFLSAKAEGGWTQLKHCAKLQEWAARIQDCHGRGADKKGSTQQPITVGNVNYWLRSKRYRAQVFRPLGLQSLLH